MSHFEGVTILKAANVYFEGKVTSRTVLWPDGTKKTLGVALPGEYEFGTAAAEIMEIQSGSLEVLLPGETAFKPVVVPGEFHVPANSKFTMRVHTVTDYICSFVK